MVEYYRTKDGQADYGFSFEEQSDRTWMVYIVNQPPYDGRDDGLAATGRSFDGARHSVVAPTLETEHEARFAAARWADATQEYITHGNSGL
jgi:hypothetical protein